MVEVALHRGVQVDLAGPDHPQDTPRSERFGDGGDAEDGVGGHRASVIAVRQAIGIGPCGCPANNRGHNHSWNTEMIENYRRGAVEVGLEDRFGRSGRWPKGVSRPQRLEGQDQDDQQAGGK